MNLVEAFHISEIVASIFAACAVILGLYHADQNRWLVNRHIAERYRLLKFRSLLDKRFWNINDNQDWREDVCRAIRNLCSLHDHEMSGIPDQNPMTTISNKVHALFLREEGEPDALEQWIKNDRVPLSPASGICTCSHEAKTEFLDYYRKKRLLFQRDYYYCSYLRFRKTQIRTQRIPQVLFIASVCAVLAHYILDFITKGSFGRITSIALIGLAVTVPITGYVIKTHRDTFQAAKSSALYYAKYSALENLNSRVSVSSNRLMRTGKKF